MNETAEQKLSRILHAHVIEADPDRAATSAWPEGFTLSQLQGVHESRGRTAFDRDWFRRHALRTGQLEETGESRSDGGRPARLYRLKA